MKIVEEMKRLNDVRIRAKSFGYTVLESAEFNFDTDKYENRYMIYKVETDIYKLYSLSDVDVFLKGVQCEKTIQ